METGKTVLDDQETLPACVVPRLLLIEDESDYVELLRRAFTRSGVPGPGVEVVRDGEAAIKLLASRAKAGAPTGELPTLVVLDLQLRRRPGFDVLSFMKSDPTLRQIPVVVLTGTERPGEGARSLTLGASSYCTKPHSFSELLVLAQSILGQGAPSGPPPEASSASHPALVPLGT